VPIAISAEQRALAASIREWAIRAGMLALVRGLEPSSGAGLPGSLPGAPGVPEHCRGDQPDPAVRGGRAGPRPAQGTGAL